MPSKKVEFAASHEKDCFDFLCVQDVQALPEAWKEDLEKDRLLRKQALVDGKYGFIAMLDTRRFSLMTPHQIIREFNVGIRDAIRIVNDCRRISQITYRGNETARRRRLLKGCEDAQIT